MTDELIEAVCSEHPYGCGDQTHRADRLAQINEVVQAARAAPDVASVVSWLADAIDLLVDEVGGRPVDEIVADVMGVEG